MSVLDSWALHAYQDKVIAVLKKEAIRQTDEVAPNCKIAEERLMRVVIADVLLNIALELKKDE